jgi:hypothetical protein
MAAPMTFNVFLCCGRCVAGGHLATSGEIAYTSVQYSFLGDCLSPHSRGIFFFFTADTRLAVIMRGAEISFFP